MVLTKANHRKGTQGIFDVESWTESGGYVQRSSSVAKGTVLGVTEHVKDTVTTALFATDRKLVPGLLLRLRTERGEDSVFLPRPEDMQGTTILGQTVEYTHRVWSTPMEGTEDQYALDILSGPSRGRKLEEKVFV